MHCWMNEILAWFKNMLLKRGWMWTGTAEELESSPTLMMSPGVVPQAPTSTNSFGIYLFLILSLRFRESMNWGLDKRARKKTQKSVDLRAASCFPLCVVNQAGL